MTPDPSIRIPFVDESGHPVGEPPVPRPGHIPCAVCTGTIYLDEYKQARCWTDPTGITCAAHTSCLIRLGEKDLHLDGAV